jgi:hypothetical protein
VQESGPPEIKKLWIGGCWQQLNRDEVAQLVMHLKSWLETGSLKIEE